MQECFTQVYILGLESRFYILSLLIECYFKFAQACAEIILSLSCICTFELAYFAATIYGSA